MAWRIVLACGLAMGGLVRADEGRIRLVVLTDIHSLTAGQGEPDDGQSLIRLMLHASEFDIEGLIASSNLRHGQSVRPEVIRRVIDAYEPVRPNLLLHDSRYPTAEALRAVVKSGQPIAGPQVAVDRSIGPGKETEGSDWLIRMVDRDDPQPVHVLAWGGTADLAQALDRVRRERDADGLARFVAKLRVRTIGDQDATGPWIREQFPGLSAITMQRCYRGIYRGGDVRLTSSAWGRDHIHGHGPHGDLYTDYDGGDIWTAQLGRVRGIKEGDTPSFLSLFPNGLTDWEHPELGSWGGRFLGENQRFSDVPDTDLDNTADLDPRMSSVYRWRPAFQAEFQARLDWCVQPYAKANHPPVVQVAGDRTHAVAPGEAIALDASGGHDPDGQTIDFAWRVYPEELHGSKVTIERADTSTPRIVVGDAPIGATIPLLLSATDRGTPPLTRYARVRIAVRREE